METNRIKVNLNLEVELKRKLEVYRDRIATEDNISCSINELVVEIISTFLKCEENKG